MKPWLSSWGATACCSKCCVGATSDSWSRPGRKAPRGRRKEESLTYADACLFDPECGLEESLSCDAFIPVGGPGPAATTRTWTGGGFNHIWSDRQNWSPQGIPGTGDTLVFPNSSSSDNDLTGLELHSIQFSGTGGTFLTGNPLSLDSDIRPRAASRASLSISPFRPAAPFTRPARAS